MMSYLILLFILFKIQAPTWLIAMDIVCLIIKLIGAGIKIGSDK